MDKKSVIGLLLAAVLAGAAGGEIGDQVMDQVVDPMQLRRLWTPGYYSSKTPTNSFNYGYRLCMENGSITTVGATAENTTEQSASITGSVTRQATHVMLLVQYQGNATGDTVEVWTTASITTKYSVYAVEAVKNCTQIVILPYSYTTDGKVYWDMSDGDNNHITTIYLWGYFEMPTGEIR